MRIPAGLRQVAIFGGMWAGALLAAQGCTPQPGPTVKTPTTQTPPANVADATDTAPKKDADSTPDKSPPEKIPHIIQQPNTQDLTPLPGAPGTPGVIAQAPATPPVPMERTPGPISPRIPPPIAPAVDPTKLAATKGSPHKTKPDELFVGWPKPAMVLMLSGQQHGYFEPCGCTGLENQKGGMARRHTLYKQLVARGWNVLALDVGNQVRRAGRQQEIKFQTTVEAQRKIGYRAVAFGPDDLKLGVGELAAAAAPIDDQPGLFVMANVQFYDLVSPFRVLAVGGKKIGITGILGTAEKAAVTSDEITVAPAADALAKVWPKLSAEKCDLYVLMSHASMEESRELAKKFPGFQLIVSSAGAGEPTFAAETVEGTKSQLVQVGAKGMYAGVVGLFDDAAQPLRYQRVPLDAGFEDSPDMLKLLSAYQRQLETLDLKGLGLKPVPHPSGRSFVGSQTCGECHTKAFAVWEKTPHAHATETLVKPPERYEVARHFDPECLSCHVTGWEPQRYLPLTGGYLNLKESKHLVGNGCENCHGPGSAHVDAESGNVTLDKIEIQKLRDSMKLPLAMAEQQCQKCHDLDNSPDFHQKGAFEKYWKKVEHKGKD